MTILDRRECEFKAAAQFGFTREEWQALQHKVTTFVPDYPTHNEQMRYGWILTLSEHIFYAQILSARENS